MSLSGRVLAYPVTGSTGVVFPYPGASPVLIADTNLEAEWGYMGFSLINTSALLTERVTVTDNTSTILDVFELHPQESRAEWYGPQGITFRGSIAMTFEVGSLVVGTIRVG